MLGQASGLNNDSDGPESTSDAEAKSSDDLVNILKGVCGDLEVKDPLEWIINEKLDDKDSMLMDGT